MLLVFAIHVAATVADGKATERMPTMSPEAQDHSVTLHEKMAEVADQDRSDCLKLAADLRATIDALSPPVLGSDNLLGEIGRDADDLPDVAPEMAHWMRLTSRRSMPREAACSRFSSRARTTPNSGSRSGNFHSGLTGRLEGGCRCRSAVRRDRDRRSTRCRDRRPSRSEPLRPSPQCRETRAVRTARPPAHGAWPRLPRGRTDAAVSR